MSAPFEIRVPWKNSPDGVWRITAPYLKLALKYGLVGPNLHEPWKYINRSVAFDAYTLRRGACQGLPFIGDFVAGLTMNSGLDGDDVARLIFWLDRPQTQEQLRHLHGQLTHVAGLHDASPAVIESIGKFADGMIDDKEMLFGIGLAKTFKWLSVWCLSTFRCSTVFSLGTYFHSWKLAKRTGAAN